MVSEIDGSWHKAQLVPPLKPHGDHPAVAAVSCGGPDSCVAGGQDRSGSVFAITARNGLWLEPRRLGSGPVGGQVQSVSCRARGYCAVGGYLLDASRKRQPFVVNEVNGIWSGLRELRGSTALNTGGVSEVLSVSCAAKTTCAAGGYYEIRGKKTRPFVADEVNGSWGAVQHVLGLPAGDVGGVVNSISCGAPGDWIGGHRQGGGRTTVRTPACTAGGSYENAAHKTQAFVVNEVDGAWGKAIEIPGLAALNVGGNAGVNAVSCAAADSCVAGGSYASPGTTAFIAEEH